MADKITLNYYKDGYLTDATTVTLSDSAAAYGIKRNSDSTVSVSAGTATTHEATGVYSYDISSLDKTYSYTYCFKVVLGSSTQYVSGHIAEDSGLTYTTLDNVRNVLRHAVEGGANQIRFSDNFIDLASSSSNVTLSNVLISTAYSGIRDVTLAFTSATAYTVTAQESGWTRSLGIGSKSSDSTTSPSWFKFLASNWTGTAVAGNTITFRTNSHISTDAVLNLIKNAEVFIDGKLESVLAKISTLVDQLYFTTKVSVPKSIRVACTYLSAYLIFTSIYPIHQVITRTQVDRNSDIDNWKKMADNLVNNYIDAYLIKRSVNVPHFYSREPIFDKIALDFDEPQDDYDDIIDNYLGVFKVNKDYRGQEQLGYHN